MGACCKSADPDPYTLQKESKLELLNRAEVAADLLKTASNSDQKEIPAPIKMKPESPSRPQEELATKHQKSESIIEDSTGGNASFV